MHVHSLAGPLIGIYLLRLFRHYLFLDNIIRREAPGRDLIYNRGDALRGVGRWSRPGAPPPGESVHLVRFCETSILGSRLPDLTPSLRHECTTCKAGYLVRRGRQPDIRGREAAPLGHGRGPLRSACQVDRNNNENRPKNFWCVGRIQENITKERCSKEDPRIRVLVHQVVIATEAAAIMWSGYHKSSSSRRRWRVRCRS